MKTSALAVALFLLASLAVGTALAAERSVVLGAVYNSSGPQAPLDVSSLRGARLAVAEANRAGGVNGRTVELRMVEGDSTTESLRAGTEALFAGASPPLV